MITYIVVTEHHCWGKGFDLKEALHNANLRPDTPEDWFCSYIEDSDPKEPMKTAIVKTWADWLDYGRDDQKTCDESVNFMLYRFDDELWEDFEISSFDGSVTFWPRDLPARTSSEIQDLFANAHTKCVWKNGMIGEGRW